MKTKGFILMATSLMMLASCGGGAAKQEAAEQVAEAEAQFEASQPLECGQYRAVSYDIEGAGARKGKFDGRLLVSLSPEINCMYVYENGNRAKINYKVVLARPFEKNDTAFVSVDNKDLPVVLAKDSLDWQLSFSKGESKIKIGFESSPMSTGTPVEMIERINAAIEKNK